MQRFWATDGNRKCAVFLFNFLDITTFTLLLSLSLFTIHLGETTVLACEMFISGCRPWLKNVACLIKLLIFLSTLTWFITSIVNSINCVTPKWLQIHFPYFVTETGNNPLTGLKFKTAKYRTISFWLNSLIMCRGWWQNIHEKKIIYCSIGF